LRKREEGKIPAELLILIRLSTPFPVVNTDIAVNNHIENGASLTINTSNTLSVNGNWVNNNTGTLSVCERLHLLYYYTTVYVKYFLHIRTKQYYSRNAQNDDEVITSLY